MMSPLNSSDKENRLSNQDTLDCSTRLNSKPRLPKTKRSRVPGKLTVYKQQTPTSVQIIDELLRFKQAKDLSSSKLFKELESIIQSLLSKNDALIAENIKLRSQNQFLTQQNNSARERLELVQGSRHRQDNNKGGSVMGYFNSIGQNPIAQMRSGEEFGIAKDLYLCKRDSNSNLRAFYLAMLQDKSTRFLLHGLVSEYKSDDSWKLVPLLSCNESWVQLTDNLFKILQQNQQEDLHSIYLLVNDSELYDLIFISALRSRIDFLSKGSYDSEIDTIELYTALCNVFPCENSGLQTNLHEKYDQYNFQVSEACFSVYFVQHNNRYAVSYHQPEKLFKSARSRNEQQQSLINSRIQLGMLSGESSMSKNKSAFQRYYQERESEEEE